MSTAIGIRPAGFFDIQVLEVLHAGAFLEEPWDAAALRSVLSMPGACARLAASQNGEPVGFTLGLLTGPECELLSIGVAKPARRRGVAALLLQDFVTLAVQSGAFEMFLEVSEDNDAARNLYRTQEFHIVGRRPDYYRRQNNTRVAALQLRRKLV